VIQLLQDWAEPEEWGTANMNDLRDQEPTSEQILADLLDVFANLSPQLRRAAHYMIDRPNEIAFTSTRTSS
tara:strand:- start:1102 stop:1314 length:213 start_codon:yes stop_codon:yes gene_type:complete